MYRRFGAFQCNLLLEGFYTRLNHVFVLEEIGKDEEHNAVIKERRKRTGCGGCRGDGRRQGSLSFFGAVTSRCDLAEKSLYKA